ncbi:methyltransferase [archaeon]|jgi:release factor glutamine methyltransferase|nr:methyltransferase [archaeon]MBT4397554.1 methyltransferase [archaeon]MBT4440809.1 methyltransferase [archaeon]
MSLYEPREDSYLLNQHVRKHAQGKVLDMGTGTGIQAITAMEDPENEVLAVDVNPEAVEYVKKKGVNAIQSNLFENVEGKFDLIIFNPPYLPEDKKEPEDSKLATTGGKKGDEILKKFLSQAKQYLDKDGKILLLISTLTGKPETLFKDYSWRLLESEEIFMETLGVYLLQ